ncbi:hypothetical protein JG688_00008066 [Phytophthora aleatoria]|uniref:START domain-containing protein n=1 Tax=Phytophthora aleatoria TaxID=2496075 RepID=A0A8J5M7M8_9STRA|nr:hypothetical protein JG688_00008066 [Phytophthora aleatoria]
MRFPLPADTFPTLVVSEEDRFELQKLSEGFIREAMEEYTDFRYADGGVLDKERWKVVKTREGVTSYRDLRMIDPERSRSAPKERVGSGVMTASTKLHGVLAIGTIEGEFNDMAFGLINGNTEMLKIKSSYTNDKIADAKVLAVIVEPTPTEPVRGTYLKWSVSTGAPVLLRQIVRPRDFVYLESIGILKTESGERIGYSLMHSLQIPTIRELTEYQIVRANASICVLFRQKSSGKIELYVKGFVDAMGDIHQCVAVPATADALMSYCKIVHCGQMKKLNWLSTVPSPLSSQDLSQAAMPSSDGLELRDNDGNDSSSLSSYDSEEFGLVARKGFARMYVLSRNIQQTDEDSKGETSKPSWNLLYASGQHYFHGPIEMPEDIHVREEKHQSPPGSFFESISRQHEGGVELRDIPRLLPLLHAQQDSLAAVDDVVDLSSGQRDAVYQMMEVGDFFVEELAKPRTTERLELGAQELPWLAEATENNNPAFFELQTHPNTNNELANAGVRLVVMKLVVRGVLLDIIYSRDSYFVTLRDNTEEIALEDTFVPNVANAGPCYLVRRYSPQLRKSAKKKHSPSRGNESKQWEDGDAGDIVDDAVVFQFNQFVYHGSAQLPARMLDDSGALTARGFPLLRAQASELAFAGVYDEILGPGGEHEAEFPRTKFLSRFATIHQKFREEMGSILLDLLIGAQKWVRDFMTEVPAASGGNALIATHLARWLEIEDGSESFFELELARGSLCPLDDEKQPLDLMVWKGIVHDALLGIWMTMLQSSFLLEFRRI